MDERLQRINTMWSQVLKIPQQGLDGSVHQNLDSIVTNTDLLLEANRTPDPVLSPMMQMAQQALMQRYHGAVYRYLLAAVRDPHVAEDLTQEFALRFIQGRFRHYSPEQGRFRDYLKSALFHLVADFRRKSCREPDLMASDFEPSAREEPTSEEDSLFLDTWRKELLARAWESLARVESETGQPYHLVLRYRSEHPERSSQQIAAELSRQLNRPLTSTNIRKLIERAREKFRQFLLEDLRLSLGNRAETDLEEELQALNLWKYCRDDLRSH